MRTHRLLEIAALPFLVAGALLAVLAVAVTHVPPVHAQSGQTTTAIYEAYAFQALAVPATAVGLTSTLVLPANQVPARHIYCTVEDAAIRVRYDGTNPDTNTGHALAVGATFTLYGSNNIRRLRAIRSSGTDGELQCSLAR